MSIEKGLSVNFSKSKYYTYYGTATYTVDLSKLSEDSISLDEESKELMARAREDMTKKLEETNAAEKAEQMAKLTIWELYQPLITNMAPGYSLNVEHVTAN